MEATQQKRRFIVPLILSAAGLTGGGWTVWEYGGFASSGDDAVAASDSLDALEQAWSEQELDAPRVTPVANEPKRAAVDPFLAQAEAAPSEAESPLAALGERYAMTDAVALPPAPEPEANEVVARGQEPRGGALDVPVVGSLPAGNPLRGSYEASPNAEQQALAQQFGDNRYSGVVPAGDNSTRIPRTAQEPGPIQIDLGAEARIQPVAAEEEIADTVPVIPPIESSPTLASPTLVPTSDTPPSEPASFVPAAEAFQATTTPPTSTEPPRKAEPLPMVNLPIATPTPAPAEAPSAPAERVAIRQGAADYALPPQASAAPPAGFHSEGNLPVVAPKAAFSNLPSMPPPAATPGDPSLEGRQQPSLAVQKFAPETVQVGKPCKFLTKIRNDSPRMIADVVVHDQTPTGAQLVGTTPSAETMGNAIRWQVGSLGPGEERTLEMEVLPTREGEIGSVATVSFSAQASARTLSTRPLLALRLSAPARVLVGQEQRLQIEVHNPGTGDATNVVLIEDVPTNLRHEAGPTLEFEIGTLRAGETRELELVMNAEEPGPVSNLLMARADGDLQVEQRVDFEVVAPALTVAVEGPSRRFLQRPATYTVRIQNPGTASARDIRLVTRLPRGMQFVKANNYGEYDAATHAVYWALTELPQGEGGEVSLTAMPTTAGEMKIEAEGKAQSGLLDTAEHEVRVEGIAAVGFRVLDVEDPIEVGGQTEYEVRVDNQGTKEATGVRVRFVAPPGMRVISANGPTKHAVDSAGVSFEPLKRLAPRDENLYRVRVQADEPGDLRMTVEVSTDDLAQPVRKEEATRVFGDE